MLTAINPVGAAFPGVSQAVRIAGDLVVLGGHVPVDEQGNLVKGDFESQLDAVFRSIGRTLEAAGLGFDSVARFTFYVARYEPSMIPVLRAVRSRYVNQEAPPASALVGVAALYDESILVEVDGIAVVPKHCPT